MLDFRLNGRSFLLDEKTSVKMKWASPACFHDKLIGDVGLGISLPDNRHNRAMLGNPERFDKYSSGSDKKFPGFEVFHSGVLLLGGTFVLKEGLSGWLQSEYGALREAQKEKTLHDMAWPANQAFSDKGFSFYNDDTDDYSTMLLYNPGFWDGLGSEITLPVTYTDEYGETKTKDETRTVLRHRHYLNYGWFVNSYNQPAILDGCVVSPYMYLRYAIHQSLKLNQWFISRNDMMPAESYDESFLKNIKIYNNYNIVDFDKTEVETEFEDKDIPSWDEDEQAVISKETYKTIIKYGWKIRNLDYKMLLPKVSYPNFLLGIQNTLNFVFHFRSGMRVDIIDRNAILSGVATDLEQWHTGVWQPGERKDVTLKFVSDYDDDDIRFSAEFEDLTSRISDFKPTVNTYADLLAIVSPELGELRMVKSQNRIYQYQWKVVTAQNELLQEMQYDALGWEFVSSGPQPYLYPENAPRDKEIEEIKTPVSEMQRTPEGWVNAPAAWQRGNLNSIRSVYNNFTLRLLPGDIATHGETLWWEGPNGLFKTRWENWARFWKNRLEVTTEFDLPLNMISYLIDNITGKFRTREGEFIIEEMECEFGMNEIGKTTIKGYKI